MRPLLAALALLAATMLPAAAEGLSGVAGTVTDADSHAPAANAAVAIYRLPLRENDVPLATVTADRNGFFSDITLEAGRYLIVASVPGLHSSCALEELPSGVVTRVRLDVSSAPIQCVAKGFHGTLVVPGQPADVYVIH